MLLLVFVVKAVWMGDMSTMFQRREAEAEREDETGERKKGDVWGKKWKRHQTPVAPHQATHRCTNLFYILIGIISFLHD